MKPKFRQQLAQLPFEEKIRKVGELIGFSRKTKAVIDLDARKGIPIECVRENVRR